MFVREKRIKVGTFFYLVENKRVEGKVKQTTLAYLGNHPTVKEAIGGFTDKAKALRMEAEQNRQEAEARWKQSEISDARIEQKQEYVLKLKRQAVMRNREAERAEVRAQKLRELWPHLPEEMRDE